MNDRKSSAAYERQLQKWDSLSENLAKEFSKEFMGHPEITCYFRVDCERSDYRVVTADAFKWFASKLSAAEKRGHDTAMAEIEQAKPEMLAKEFHRGYDSAMYADITLCPHCGCMTKTVDGKCGKCGGGK